MNAQLNLLEWLGLVASLATIISFCVNILQWRSAVNLRRQIHSRVFSEWNQMYRIAELADASKRILNVQGKSQEQQLAEIIRNIEQCTGIADSSRQELLAFSERYLRKPIRRQHPAEADPSIK